MAGSLPLRSRPLPPRRRAGRQPLKLRRPIRRGSTCPNTTQPTSGDRPRGAHIRRSITPDTAMDSARGSTSDSTWAGGAAGATAAGGGGGRPNWFGRSVFINGGFFNRYGYRGGLYAGGFAGRSAWQHDASHRLGVSYPNGQLAARYGTASMASRSAMARSGSVNSTRSATAGNWNRFGSGTASTSGN